MECNRTVCCLIPRTKRLGKVIFKKLTVIGDISTFRPTQLFVCYYTATIFDPLLVMGRQPLHSKVVRVQICNKKNYERIQVQFHTVSNPELALLLRTEPRQSIAFDTKSDGPQSRCECRKENISTLANIRTPLPQRPSCTQSVSLTEDTSALRKLLCTLTSTYGTDG